MNHMENNIGYNGLLTGDVRTQLTELLFTIGTANLMGRKDLKRLCNIGMELLDNAQRYGGGRHVGFEWRLHADRLEVRIVNRASKEDAERLMELVERIARMTDEEVARAFAERLSDAHFGEKGGAGLGLLQIAKRSGHRVKAGIAASNQGDYICSSEVIARLQ